MSGISKGRIATRIAALKEEFARQQTLVAQYAAAIAELEELLKPEETPQSTEYIEASESEHVTSA